MQLMIPGTMQCTKGWTPEYHGYLMSSKTLEQHSTNLVCVDDAPEVGTSVLDRSLGKLYPVEARCDTLPCPGYVNNRELTCVVCSK